MKEQPTGTNQLAPADVERAKQQAADLRQKLPNEFTLASHLHRNGTRLFPDLVFKADPEIPGLFRAAVDPDVIMGRTAEGTAGFKVKEDPK